MARKSKRFRLILVLIVLLLAVATFNYWPWHQTIIISPQTTVIDGPVNPDGTINYVAYLDAKYAQGVTPANNAAPLLLRAFGCSNNWPPAQRAQLFSKLGLSESDTSAAQHMVRWDDRALKTPTTAPVARSPGTRDEYKDIDKLSDAILDGSFKGDPDLDAWLLQNAAAIQLVYEASSKSRLYLPLVPKSNPPSVADDICPPGFVEISQAANALLDRALVRLHSRDYDGGWADVMAIHRLGRLAGQGPDVIAQLIAMSIEKRVASRAGIFALTRTSFPAQKLQSALTDLQSLPPAANMAETIDVSERFLQLDVAMMASRGDPRMFESWTARFAARFLDYNEMLRDMNQWCDQVVEALRKPRFDASGAPARAKAVDELQARLEGTYARGTLASLESVGGLATGKAAARHTAAVMMAMLLPSMAKLTHVQDEASMSLEIEKMAAALAIYKARHGRYPASLKELCPELLKEVPKDVFSPEGEFVYRANDNAYIVYVGKNLKRDGEVSDGKDKYDIVAKVGDVDSATTLPTSQPGR